MQRRLRSPTSWKDMLKSVYVDDMIKKAGRKQTMAPMWKKWMKLENLGEPTSSLDHIYLGCKPNEIESRMSAAAHERLPGWGKPHAETVAWSYDMEGPVRKCVERECELAHKKT